MVAIFQIFFKSAAIFLTTLSLLLITVSSFSRPKTLGAAYDYKIDTRSATLQDVMGTFAVDNSSYEYTNDATSLDQDTKIMAELKSFFSDLDSHITVPKSEFRYARIFGIHDHIEHGVNSYRCYSDNSTLGEMKESYSTNCPVYGLSYCIAYHQQTRTKSDGAYQSINTGYLNQTTSFNASEIAHIASLYSNLSDTQMASQRIKFSNKFYLDISNMNCYDTYDMFEAPLRREKPWRLAVGACVTTGIALVMAYFSPSYSLGAMIVALALTLAEFGVVVKNSKSLHDAASGVQGIKFTATVNGGAGAGAFMIVAFSLQVITLGLLVLLSYMESKKAQGYNKC